VAPTATPTPAPTPTLPVSSSASATAGAAATSATLATIQAGYGGVVSLPATTSGTGTATLGLATSNASGVPTVSSSARLPRAIGGSLTTLVYLTFSTTAPLTFATWPALSFTLPSSVSLQSGSLYLAFYNPANATAGWSTLAGPAVFSGSQVSFAPIPGPITFAPGPTYAFALIATGQVLVASTPTPVPATSPSASPTLLAAAAFTCPTTGTASVARSSAAGEATRRAPLQMPAQTMARLRAQATGQSTGAFERRYRLTKSAVYTNDPYFQGFTPNFEQLPYAESAAVPGQWDMHAIGLEHAFGYSEGSSTVKIAIIDTGEDANHPELNGKIVYQHCFISGDQTGPTPAPQSTGNFSTDADGHGTDVSGIAAAAGGNSLGFVGAGGNTVIYAYRVFPTPDDNCAGAGTDDVCSASTVDIASAINDAIAHNVNVISMSLGGGGCTNGVDSDATEGAAVAKAIAANIVVVAAAGNAGGQGLTAPACDTGVIAAGATSLDDGQTTGTSGHYSSSLTSNASPTNIVEYVASYSQYGSPGANVRNANAWGIVAPGGDPGGGGDNNDLHWIENIWTTTPFVSSPSDTSFTGACASDFGTASQVDCRTLIAGTSMATPHVAGAAALILAVNSAYQSPAAMKVLLCSTADDISDSHEGCGRLNVYRAMATAIGDTNPP
jgi:thermitase